MTVVSASAGSGKTYLLRSWIRDAGLTERVAWVSVQDEDPDPQRFWISVAEALRDATVGSAPVREVTAAPDLDGWAIVERLLEDLGALDDQVWLVIDDLHELGSSEALGQLELLLMRAPRGLRFLLATRRDMRLGLHRLRLEGELTEIRAAELRFTRDEARALLHGAGVQLSDAVLAQLIERVEGWAAGLRLAALSLVGHADPERFAAQFSGSERTVAEYLFAEVLDRQSEPVRRLLLRTSLLERVNGELADLLTGGSGGERILQELEAANAFAAALDPARSWFRYHQLFGELLQLELRRTAPDEVQVLHATASGWFAEHGCPVEAIRHAQAAQDWSRAARLLADHWLALALDGQVTTAHNLLAGFPPGVVAADVELVALTAAAELDRGSLDGAERYLALAAGELESIPADRRGVCESLLAVLRMLLGRQRGDLPAVVEEMQRLLGPSEALDSRQFRLGGDLRTVTRLSLGIAELWSLRVEEAERHLEQGLALARRTGRPYLEISSLAHGALAASFRCFAEVEERGKQAIELARRHGWLDEPVVAVAYLALCDTAVRQGDLERAERYLGHAERALRAEVQPAAALLLDCARGHIEMARGCDEEAVSAFRAADRLTEQTGPTRLWAGHTQALLLLARARLGDTELAERALSELDDEECETAQMRTAVAALRLAQNDPQAAILTLAPVLEGSVAVMNLRDWAVQPFLLEAIARDRLGEPATAWRALEHALDLAESHGILLPFLLYPAPRLLERHARDRTAHAALVSELLDRLAGKNRVAPPGDAHHLREPLSDSETRVLRHLPTNLSAPEIAAKLCVSVNTVRTHTRHVYEKLGAHSRAEAVEGARALGLLAPSSRRP
ncbi:LuxR C-terminal-related transcriptional regulator [Streptomyces sp. NPDC005917]|uniref:LuxR C-terminal-related transcriptional regulator n=1 Tax=unclassified Streptomyces TaxID=2593676 RepID=UPI00340129A8